MLLKNLTHLPKNIYEYDVNIDHHDSRTILYTFNILTQQPSLWDEKRNGSNDSDLKEHVFSTSRDDTKPLKIIE